MKRGLLHRLLPAPLTSAALAGTWLLLNQSASVGNLLIAAVLALVLPWIVVRAEPLVTGWLGLPKEAAAAFVMGFLRRDFGATGLFAMGASLSAAQALVGMVTITLFVPCIASVLMIGKEQGAARAALMVAMIMPTAVLVGGLVRLALVALGLA